MDPAVGSEHGNSLYVCPVGVFPEAQSPLCPWLREGHGNLPRHLLKRDALQLARAGCFPAGEGC